MLSTTALPGFGLAVVDDDEIAMPWARQASFGGGCGCMSAEVGAEPPAPASSQADMAPTVDLAVGLIVGAVVLLLIAVA